MGSQNLWHGDAVTPNLKWLNGSQTVVHLHVKAQPRASRNEIGEVLGSELKIKITAPPVDSAANEALLKFFAELLGCRSIPRCNWPPAASARLLKSAIPLSTGPSWIATSVPNFSCAARRKPPSSPNAPDARRPSSLRLDRRSSNQLSVPCVIPTC